MLYLRSREKNKENCCYFQVLDHWQLYREELATCGHTASVKVQYMVLLPLTFLAYRYQCCGSGIWCVFNPWIRYLGCKKRNKYP
jgi:hypothetical protein